MKLKYLRICAAGLLLASCTDPLSSTPSGGGANGGGGSGASGAGAAEGGNPSGGGTGGNQGGSGGDGGAGAGGPIPTCELVEGVQIASDCGVFVGTTAGVGELGTKTNPYLNLSDALANLTSTKDIYVCNDFQETGSFTIPEGARIFGKLDCGTYAYDPGSLGPVLIGTMDSPVFRVEGDATLFGLRVNAVAGLGLGASSIGVLVTAGTLQVTESSVTAAAGNQGEAGDAPAVPMAPSGPNGMPGTDGCDGSATNNDGGPGGTALACSVSTQAGNGGDGGTGRNGSSGFNGFNGGPNGKGGLAGNSQTSSSTCSNGGAPTVAVMHGGVGAAVAALGTLSSTTPFYLLPESQQAGEGLSGRGGGGGGGGRQCANNNAGPGGGGGGAGGCGGLGGNSGASGGASFGIVLLGPSELVVTDTSITASGGGDGGDGAVGQLGGNAGSPGSAGAGNFMGAACSGGSGRAGGNGGPGAAGPGGPSAAIARAFSSQVVTLNGSTTLEHGAAGAPGTQASGGLPGSVGLTCEALQILSFDVAACE